MTMRPPAKHKMSEFDRAYAVAATDWIIILIPLMIFMFLAISKSVLYVQMHGYGILNTTR